LSRNVWEPFGYASLFDTAQSKDLPHRLVEEDLELFRELDTDKFEFVLNGLNTSIAVLSALNRQTDFLTARYESIRLALVDAVHSVHCPWAQFGLHPV
jgi:hypothetical protein